MVCAQTNTATNLIEPKMWPLLWMGWQEILYEVGHLHLPGPSTDGLNPHLAPNAAMPSMDPRMAWTIHGWHGSASGTEHIAIAA